MKHVVVRKIARPEQDTVHLLGELGVATVHEAQGRTGLMRRTCGPSIPERESLVQQSRCTARQATI